MDNSWSWYYSCGRANKGFCKKDGMIEGIQLWLNLPAEKKMIQANYQRAKHEDFRIVISED